MKYKVEICGFKFFPLCLAFPLFPLIKIDITNLNTETIERFKNKNYEYKTSLVAYIIGRYWRFLMWGMVSGFFCVIISLPKILPEIISEFSGIPISMRLLKSNFIIFIVGFCVPIASFVWVIYFKDNIKINHEGVFCKGFLKEKFIRWEEIEDIRQSILFKICILILKEKNIFKKYIFFYLSGGSFPFIWSIKIAEVCKFIKFKIEEVNKSDV